MFPRTRYSGEGGTIHLGTLTIGKLGEWKVCYFGDDRPYFTATGCDVPQRWLSAGLKRLTVRPRLGARPSMEISGDVRLFERGRLNLGNLEGAD
jgi:hypothetical protein